jgi:hypothetical protein
VDRFSVVIALAVSYTTMFWRVITFLNPSSALSRRPAAFRHVKISGPFLSDRVFADHSLLAEVAIVPLTNQRPDD